MSKINSSLFDQWGKKRFGSGYPICVKWHPLYVENEECHCLAVGYNVGEIRLFHLNEDGRDEKPRLVLAHVFGAGMNPSSCLCLDWSSDGQYLIAEYDDNSLRKFDTYAKKEVEDSDFNWHVPKNAGVLSPDGRFIVSIVKYFSYGRGRTKLMLCDASTGMPVPGFDCKDLTGHGFGAVNFSPDGRHIVSADIRKHGTLRLWDASTGSPVDGFDGCSGDWNIPVHVRNSVSFSPDGRFIVSTHERWDYAIYLWEASTGRLLTKFVGDICHLSSLGILYVSFSPDGRHIASGSQGMNHPVVWKTSTGTSVNAPTKARFIIVDTKIMLSFFHQSTSSKSELFRTT